MRKDIALILLILAILALIIVPLGPAVLDALLSINLSLAVLLLIVAVYLKHPADFATFPTVILLGTAFRLALSIATTRQILTEADAGQIIETFGSFVIAGNIAIGLIVFLIITVFQFLVVTKGAERVAEVGARFALDALPGKQMSIDADLRAENIDKATAAERRDKLERESQFFGSMDGAMKFVKGDAIAGLIIIFINLIGGITAGMMIHGFSFEQAVQTYTLLTLGDGLVAQLPALLMALCAGIVTTRIEGKDNIDLGTDIWRDLVADPRVPAAASGIVLLIGLIPGFPLLNFAIAATVLLVVSFSVRRVLLAEAEAEMADAPSVQPKPLVDPEPVPEPVVSIPRSKRVTLQIAQGLHDRVDMKMIDSKMQRHFSRLAQLRGLTLDPPSLEVLGDGLAQDDSFSVVLDEVPLITETVPANMVLLQCDESLLDVLEVGTQESREARWHEFQGHWVPARFEDPAAKTETDTIPIETYVAYVAYRIVEGNIGTLFSQEEFEKFLDQVEAINPAIRKDLGQTGEENMLFLALRYLVEDGVPLRPAGLIVETFMHWFMIEGNIGAVAMAERMRGSLKRQICHALSGGKGLLGAVLLDPTVEETAHAMVAQTGLSDSAASMDGLPLDVDSSEEILGQFRELTTHMPMDEPMPVVIASAGIRRRMRNYLSANRISLPVLAPHELSPEIQLHPVARIQLAQQAYG
ncbi:MAG: flagellar biosynthesis protein FlhA [Pseudomonadota bacterium]